MKRKILAILLALTAIFAFAFTACNNDSKEDENKQDEQMENKIVFTIGETKLTATLEENGATVALIDKLKTAPITIDMDDYGGWEKVGGFGFDLPASDEQITAQPCEFVLYQGDQLVIFYGSNSWSYTRLGKFDNVSQDKLKAVLGSGSVTVTLSLASVS